MMLDSTIIGLSQDLLQKLARAEPVFTRFSRVLKRRPEPADSYGFSGMGDRCIRTIEPTQSDKDRRIALVCV